VPAKKLLGELEDYRLYYVAATRARDHLVVSLHHKAGGKSHAAQTYALCQAGGMPLTTVPAAAPESGPPQAGTPPTAAVLEDRAAWLTQRAELLRANARARTLAATVIAHGLELPGTEVPVNDGQTDPEQPWRRGRAGTNLGRAVHAVLQSIDLATGEGLAAAAAAQAVAEGVPGRESEIIGLVRVALGSHAVREAVASRRFWREVYVAADVDGTVIEGFIDLLYETPEGLVIVDYKTDSARDDAEVNAAMERYTSQGAAYALALQQAMPGRKVAKCVFVFVRPDREPAITDLTAAIAAVRGSLATAAAAL